MIGTKILKFIYNKKIKQKGVEKSQNRNIIVMLGVVNMNDYNNNLVVRKKKYAYIFLIVIFLVSVVGSNLYFSSLKDEENKYISGDVESSGETESSGDEFNNEDVSSGEIIVDNASNENIDIINSESGEDVSGDATSINYFANNRKLDPNKPMVALTFDDGPDPKRTIKMLEILKKNNAVATFFDIGTLMEKYPDVVKKEVEARCDVGGHTYSHVNLNSLSQEEVKKEIENVENAFKNATGQELKYIRPTYGNANSKVREVVDRPIINWCVDSLDWKYRDADKVIEEIRKTKNFDGRIILMHVIYDSTLEAVERLIPQLIDEGYQIVTVSEMAQYKGFELENGKIYYQFIK